MVVLQAGSSMLGSLVQPGPSHNHSHGHSHSHGDLSSSSAAEEDSQGKHKAQAARSRSRTLATVFCLGLCAGFVFAQWAYLRSKPGGPAATLATPGSAGSAAGGGGSSASVQAAGGAGALALARLSGEPRSELERVLRQVAPQGEVMIAISNYNLIVQGMLNTWLQTVQQAGVPNYLVVAIDQQLYDHLTERKVPVYFKDLTIDKAQEGTGDNHAISALKFKIIREFLALGWSVLLSDVDVVTVQNPFDHLYRDADVEGMSDGYDENTAYGHIHGEDDPSMGWSRYVQATRHFAFNSGLFYIRANERTIWLMDRIATRLAAAKAWDQSVYNEELFFLSHDDYKAPGCSVRVMNIYKFMNSKILFKRVRHLPRAQQTRPVMVHMNYHPDKHERMKAAVEYYLNGNDHALEPFPGGSEPGSRRRRQRRLLSS